MTWQKSCQLDTTSVWQGRSRATLARLQYDGAEVVPWHDFSMTGQKSCLIGTIFAYEVVPNWHDLPKFVFFLNGPHFGKKKKKTPSWSKNRHWPVLCSYRLPLTRIVRSWNSLRTNTLHTQQEISGDVSTVGILVLKTHCRLGTSAETRPMLPLPQVPLTGLPEPFHARSSWIWLVALGFSLVKTTLFSPLDSVNRTLFIFWTRTVTPSDGNSTIYIELFFLLRAMTRFPLTTFHYWFPNFTLCPCSSEEGVFDWLLLLFLLSDIFLTSNDI